MHNRPICLPSANPPRRRLSRPIPLAIKTSQDKIDQIDRLMDRTGMLKIDVIEAALDVFEAKLDADDRREAEEN